MTHPPFESRLQLPSYRLHLFVCCQPAIRSGTVCISASRHVCFFDVQHCVHFSRVLLLPSCDSLLCACGCESARFWQLWLALRAAASGNSKLTTLRRRALVARRKAQNLPIWVRRRIIINRASKIATMLKTRLKKVFTILIISHPTCVHKTIPRSKGKFRHTYVSTIKE